MAGSDRRNVLREMSAKDFRNASEALGQEITANTIDKFFYAVAAYLEDHFDDFSVGQDLRGVVGHLLDGLELDTDSPQVKIRNKLSPHNKCWYEALDEIMNKTLVDTPEVLSSFETNKLVNAFDDQAHGWVHGDNIEIIARIVENVGIAKAAEKLSELEDECGKKGAQ